MDEAIRKADVLIEALPYIKEFRNKVFVIKYGGSILSEETIRKGVLEDIVFLSFMGIKTILVHGGGINISGKLKDIGKKSEFINGMRVTDAETLAVVEKELNVLNKMIVSEIKEIGANVTGVSGKDDGLITARKKNAGDFDMGYVGDVVEIKADLIEEKINKNSILVITPMGIDKKGVVYNINADEVASHVSSWLAAEKFVLLTNVKGVMRDTEDKDSLITSLNLKEINTLIENKIIQSGMIPKVGACIYALKRGVKKTHIIDARIPHALLLEIFTDKGVGTEIVE